MRLRDVKPFDLVVLEHKKDERYSILYSHGLGFAECFSKDEADLIAMLPKLIEAATTAKAYFLAEGLCDCWTEAEIPYDCQDCRDRFDAAYWAAKALKEIA